MWIQFIGKLQNSACRSILCRECDSSTREMHSDKLLLSLSDRRYLHMSMECHSLWHFFVLLTEVRPRLTQASESNKLHVPRVRTTVGSKAFRVCGPVFWNKLSDDNSSKQNPKTFKAVISTSLLQATRSGNQNVPTQFEDVAIWLRMYSTSCILKCVLCIAKDS